MKKIAYTYDDIQLIPRYSEVTSRKEINLQSKLTRNFDIVSPFVAAPMDTVCEYDMAIRLLSMGSVGCIHRFMTIDDQVNNIKNIKLYISQNTDKLHSVWGDLKIPILAAVGVGDNERIRVDALVDSGCNIILIDVAHGHHKNVKDMISWIKSKYSVDVIAGSVATYTGTEDLIKWGADAVRVGIGGGCFTPHMEVKTDTGFKKIKDIEIGDQVYTHTGELKPVINKFEYTDYDEVYDINGIEATENHKFYVIHTSKADLVDENNIHEYAEWVMAKDLTNEYFLIEL